MDANWLSDFYKDLRAIQESTFPKRCALCKTTYKNLADFLERTSKVHSSPGLQAAQAEDDQYMVALFRNCACGSTLMVECRDRRDVSRKGLKAREAFGNLMDMLKKAGVGIETARRELLTVIRGGESKTLKDLGIVLDRPE